MRHGWKHSLTTALAAAIAQYVQHNLPGIEVDPTLLMAGLAGLFSHYVHAWICQRAWEDAGGNGCGNGG